MNVKPRTKIKLLTRPRAATACCSATPEAAAQCCAKASRLIAGCHD
jgi:hypothetical protein